MFVHKEGFEYQNLKTKNINGKRHYVTPDGNYPSVTTVTSLAIKYLAKGSATLPLIAASP